MDKILPDCFLIPPPRFLLFSSLSFHHNLSLNWHVTVAHCIIGLQLVEKLTEKRSQFEILRNKDFRAHNGSRTYELPQYRLDTPTTELWETRGEHGHILGSDVCDTCPAILLYFTYHEFTLIIISTC